MAFVVGEEVKSCGKYIKVRADVMRNPAGGEWGRTSGVGAVDHDCMILRNHVSELLYFLMRQKYICKDKV